MGPLTVLSNADVLELQRTARLLESGYAVLEAFRCEKELATLTIHLLYRMALMFTAPVDGVISRAEKKKVPIAGCPLFGDLDETLHGAFKYFERFTGMDYREHLLIGNHPNVFFLKFEQDVVLLMDKFQTTFQLKAAFCAQLDDKESVVMVAGPKNNSSPASVEGDEKPRRRFLIDFQCDLRDLASQAAASNAMMDRMLAKRRFSTSREVETFVKIMRETAEYIHEAMDVTTKLVGGGPFSVIRQPAMRSFWQDHMSSSKDCSTTLPAFCDALNSYLTGPAGGGMTPSEARALVQECTKGPFRQLQLDSSSGHVDVVEVAKLCDCLSRFDIDLKSVLTALVALYDKLALESEWLRKKDPKTGKDVYVHKKTKAVRQLRPHETPPVSVVQRFLPSSRPMVNVSSSTSTSATSPPSSLLPLPPVLPPFIPVPPPPPIPPPPVHVFWNVGQEKLLSSALTTLGWVLVGGPRMVGKTTRILSLLQKEPLEGRERDKNKDKDKEDEDLTRKDKVFVDFSGVRSDAEARARICTQLRLKQIQAQDGDSLVRALKELFSSLRPRAVIVLDNVDSLVGLQPPVSSQNKGRKTVSVKAVARAETPSTPTPVSNKTFLEELLDSLRPWQSVFCIVLVMHSEPVKSALGATIKAKAKAALAGVTGNDGSKKSRGGLGAQQQEPRAHDQFQVPTYVEQAFASLPQKRKIAITPLSYKPALALARSLQVVDAESLVQAGRYFPGEMVLLHRFCSLKTIRAIASLRAKDATQQPAIAAPATAAASGAAGGGKEKDPNGAIFAQSLSPGASVRRLWDAATNLLLKDLLASMSPDEHLAATAVIPGIPPINEACGWATCREVFGGDLLRWRVAFRGLIRCGWLVEAGDAGYITLAPLGFVVPARAPTAAEDAANSAAAVPAPSAPTKPPPPPPRQLKESSPSALPVAPLAATPKSHAEVMERRSSQYLHYWAAELTRIDLLCEENTVNSVIFDQHLPHLRIMLASLVAATLGVDLRSGDKLQGAEEVTDSGGGATSSSSPRRMISFGRSLSPSFTLKATLEKRDESELEIPLLFTPNPSTLGTRLAGHLGRLLTSRFPPSEGVLIARAVLQHVVEQSPQKDSFEYLAAGTDLGEQLRRVGLSIEGCSLLRFITKKFSVDLDREVKSGSGGDEAKASAGPPSKSGSTSSSSNMSNNPQQRSAVARALFVYSTLLHSTSRQAEALEYSQRAVKLWENCPPTADIRQRLLVASSREMLLGNDTAAQLIGANKCQCSIQ